MKDNLMVQQQVINKWQHMVGVICLNQTGRKKVKKLLPAFFEKFPTAEELLESNRETIASMLEGLGLKHGTKDPVITVKTSKSNQYGHEVIIHGMAKVIYSPDKPLSCGAKVWIETESEVEVKDVCVETSKIL